jgi:hypothetical protein
MYISTVKKTISMFIKYLKYRSSPNLSFSIICSSLFYCTSFDLKVASIIHSQFGGRHYFETLDIFMAKGEMFGQRLEST